MAFFCMGKWTSECANTRLSERNGSKGIRTGFITFVIWMWLKMSKSFSFWKETRNTILSVSLTNGNTSDTYNKGIHVKQYNHRVFLPFFPLIQAKWNPNEQEGEVDKQNSMDCIRWLHFGTWMPGCVWVRDHIEMRESFCYTYIYIYGVCAAR